MSTFDEQYKQLFGDELDYDPIGSPDSAERPTPRLDRSAGPRPDRSPFGKQYKQLFGKELTVDPIDIDAPDTEYTSALRRSLTAGVSSGSADPQSGRLEEMEAQLRGMGAAPDEETGIVGEIGRQLAGGVGDVGMMVAGGLEYAARQAEDHVDAGVGKEILGDIRRNFTSARQSAQQFSEDVTAGMDAQSIDRMHRHVLSLDPENSIWRGSPGEVFQSIALKVARSLPATVAMIAPAGLMMRAGMGRAGLTYFAGAEGSLSAGGLAAGLAQEIESMSHEDLEKESVYYAQLINQGLGEQAARTQLIAQAQGAAPLIAGIMVGAISAVTGRLLVPVFAPKVPGAGMGIAKRFGVGFGEEALQETPQSGVEQVMQNIASTVFAADRGTWEGAAEAMAEGMLIGGITGGFTTAAFGTRPQKEVAAPEATETDPTGQRPQSPVEPVESEGGQLEMFSDADAGSALGVTDYAPDLTAPPGAVDPRQADLLDATVEGVAVSAEPIRDINAQFDELQRPESDREAVFLSPDNLAHLQEMDELAPLLERGVPIANFDGQGGTLVARDRTTAEALLQLRAEAFTRNRGSADNTPIINNALDEIVGTATGAGTGRPVGGQIVVQRRDESGNVVQESLVDSVEEAESLTVAWQRQNPNFEIITMPAEGSIQRRGMLIDEERRAIVREENRQARLGTLAAAQQLGQAVTEQAIPEQQRIGGFYPPSALKFAAPAMKGQYTRAWNELVNIELQIEEGKVRVFEGTGDQATRAVRDRRGELLDRLAEVRQKAKPVLVTEKLVRRAARISPKVVSEERTRAIQKATKPAEGMPAPDRLIADVEMLKSLTDEKIDTLEGNDLEAVFSHAANWMLGQYRAIQLYYEGVESGAVSADPDNIPAGAELIAAHTPEQREPKPLRELVSAKRGEGPKGEKGPWVHYEVAQNGETFTGISRGTLKHVKETTLKKLVEEYNKQAIASNKIGMKGVTLEVLYDRNMTPSSQRKLIRRVHHQLIGREFGEKIKTKPITKGATRARVGEGAMQGVATRLKDKQKGRFNPNVLADERITKDESKDERDTRLVAVAAARSDLDKSLRRAAKHHERLTKGRFAAFATQRDPTTGDLSDAAKSLTYGRAYFRMIAEYGQALFDSGYASKAMLAELKSVTGWLNDGMKLSPNEFSRTIGNLMLAEGQEQVRALKGFPDKFKAKIASPAKRRELNAKLARNRAKESARLYWLETTQKSNPYWRNIVAPLMRNFTNSIFADGHATYRPSESELSKVKWVMDNWNIPRLQESLHEPLKSWFSSIGIKFDKKGSMIIPRDKDGKYDYQISQDQLEVVFQKQFGNEAETVTPTTHVQYVHHTELEKREQAEGPPKYELVNKYGRQYRPGTLARDVRERQFEDRDQISKDADRSSELKEFAMRMQANRVIEKTRKVVANPRTTIAGLIRAEERFIEAMKVLDMWTDVSPRFGKIKQRLARFNKPRNKDDPGTWTTGRRYHIVGSRLQNKEMKKEDARKSMLKGLKVEAIPKDLAADPILVGRPMGELPQLRGRANEPVIVSDAMFLEITDPGPADMGKFQDLAISIIDTLDNNSATPMNGLLDRVIAALPSDHVYHKLAQKLRDLNMDDVPVSWDHRGQIESPKVLATAKWELQAWNPRDGEKQLRYILMARETLKNAPDPTLSTIHALLHESVHMATQGALENNPHVRQAIHSIRHIARQEWRNRNPGKPDEHMPYALAHPNEAEFMAETFSNIQTQNFLKTVRIENTNLWNKILKVIQSILGPVKWLQQTPQLSALDAMMSLEHPLFTNESRALLKKDVESAMLEIDPTMRPTAQSVMDLASTNLDRLTSGWQAVKNKINAPLPLMSMRQIHKNFRDYFETTGLPNPLDNYKSFWEKRDAENTRLKKIGEDILREWTKHTERLGVGANKEFSKIATESTLFSIDPTVPLTDDANAHVTSTEQQAKHAELAERYEVLPDEYRTLWKEVRKYYDTALKEETDLIMMNALRTMLTAGNLPSMTKVDFDNIYTPKYISDLSLTSVEALTAEFGELLTEKQIQTVQQIASIPQMRQGPYFPLMRYGDFVVYAQRTIEQKPFADRKEASAYAAEKQGTDPTLDINITTEGNKSIVNVVERDFRTFETRTEAAAAREEMIEMYGDVVTDVQKKDKFDFENVEPKHSGLQDILTALKDNPGAQNAMKDWWLSNLRDSSFRKHEIKRKNRRGVDYELQQRNFGNYVTKSSYYRSHLKFGWKMAEAMRELKQFVRDYKQLSPSDPTNERLGQIRDHLIKREAMVSDMGVVNKYARRGTEVGQVYLLVGPSFWLINASQPWLVSLPWMAARHGWHETAAALKNAQALIAHPMLKAGKDSRGGFTLSKEKLESAFNVLDQIKTSIKKNGGERADQYIEMLDVLREHNVMDLSWIAELRDISEGSDTSLKQKILDGSRVMAHLTEVNNRIFTSIAAYDLQYAKTIKEGGTEELAHRKAIAFAEDAVAETHFDYSAGNKPLLFQPKGPLGSFAPLVFQFMQYPQHIYAMMLSNMVAMVKGGHIDRKVARDTMIGVLGLNIAFAGMIGVALQPLKWMVGLTMLAFGDDDEPVTFASAMSGEAFDRSVRKGAAAVFGDRLGHAVSRGVPAALGVDVSDRLSLGSVYFLDLRTDTAQSTIGSVVTGLGGPWLTIGSNMARGAGKIGDGQVLRGMEMMAPKMIRDLMRAYRYAGQGVVNNAGDTILDAEGLHPLQLLAQSIGFTPSEISELYSRQSLIKDIERYGTDRRNSLLRHFRTADNLEDRGAVLDEIRDFNKAFPHAPITRSSLVRAVRGKAEREASQRRFGANLRGRARILGQEGAHYR